MHVSPQARGRDHLLKVLTQSAEAGKDATTPSPRSEHISKSVRCAQADTFADAGYAPIGTSESSKNPSRKLERPNQGR